MQCLTKAKKGYTKLTKQRIQDLKWFMMIYRQKHVFAPVFYKLSDKMSVTYKEQKLIVV